MNERALHRSLLALRLVMGLVIFWLSWPTAFPHEPAEIVPFHGLGTFIRMLAGVEMLGAVLLLIPQLVQLGARTLIGVLAVAIVVHLLHGEYRVGPLIIYAAATIVILAADDVRRRESKAVASDRKPG